MLRFLTPRRGRVLSESEVYRVTGRVRDAVMAYGEARAAARAGVGSNARVVATWDEFDSSLRDMERAFINARVLP